MAYYRLYCLWCESFQLARDLHDEIICTACGTNLVDEDDTYWLNVYEDDQVLHHYEACRDRESAWERGNEWVRRGFSFDIELIYFKPYVETMDSVMLGNIRELR